MATIHAQLRIDRTPDEVWQVLGDLGAVGEWVPGISAVHVEGAKRICTMSDGPEIHEEISDFSDADRCFSYSQVVHPLGFKSSRGTLAVTAAGSGSEVRWDAEIEFADKAQEAQVLPMLEQGYAAALAALKGRVEA